MALHLLCSLQLSVFLQTACTGSALVKVAADPTWPRQPYMRPNMYRCGKQCLVASVHDFGVHTAEWQCCMPSVTTSGCPNIQLSGAHHLPHSAVSRLTAPAHLRQCEHKNGSLCLVDSAAALIGWRLELL